MDFVVGDEAFTVHEDGIVTINPDVPIRVGSVAVDPISVGSDERHLIEALARSFVRGGVPILPIEALVGMKLKSPRRKDAVDVVELVKAGIDTARVSTYLSTHAAHLAAKFEALVAEAADE
ncbi:MAG: hypothetical protein FJW27_03245 [Acidimicrobiia bacterium]|nr:hypothetical protein [Acidimicrobiia bacterium]